MAALVDEFVIALGLDPTDFTKGQKSIADGLLKTRNAADTTAKQLEESGKRGANFFSLMRNELVGFLLAVAGANSIKTLGVDILNNAASVGRLSDNIGVSTERISAWQGAMQAMGGSAEDANGALSAMARIIGDSKLNPGRMPPELAALGVANDDLRSPEAMLLRISEMGQKMDRFAFVDLAQRLGLSPSAILLLEQGRVGVQKLLDEEQKNYAVTKQQADAARAFDKTLSDLTRTIKGDAAPALFKLVGYLDALSANKDNLQAAGDAIAGTIAAIGIAAVTANPEIAALAAVLTVAAKAYQEFAAPQAGARAMRSLSETGKMAGDLWGALHGDPKGMGDRVAAVLKNDPWTEYGVPIGGAPAPSGGAPSGGPKSADGIARLAERFTARGASSEAAIAIAAGIYGEGGGVNAKNPKSGAFGIGQWLGPRKKALFAKYGPHPSLHQQIDFLWAELTGGDRGGAAVLNAKDRYSALWAYDDKFMRPDLPGMGHVHALQDYGRSTALMAKAAASGAISIGTINVYGAKDSAEVAKNIHGALRKRMNGTQADSAFGS